MIWDKWNTSKINRSMIFIKDPHGIYLRPNLNLEEPPNFPHASLKMPRTKSTTKWRSCTSSTITTSKSFTSEDDKQNIESTNIRYSIYIYIGNRCFMCVCVNFHVILHGICDLWNMICTIGWYIILLVPFTYKGFLAINCSTSGSLSNRRSRMPSVTKRILVFLGWPPSFGMPGTWLNPTASSFTPFFKNHPMHSLGFRLQKKKTES